jgi:hypothetical protein
MPVCYGFIDIFQAPNRACYNSYFYSSVTVKIKGCDTVTQITNTISLRVTNNKSGDYKKLFFFRQGEVGKTIGTKDYSEVFS